MASQAQNTVIRIMSKDATAPPMLNNDTIKSINLEIFPGDIVRARIYFTNGEDEFYMVNSASISPLTGINVLLVEI